MNETPSSPSSSMLGDLRGLLPELEKLYTDVHAHPELSMQETRTAGLAAGHLRTAGYEVTSDIGKTGVDVISIGALTHSARAIDFSCSIRPVEGGARPTERDR